MKTLIIDAKMGGISGDMLLSSLMDLNDKPQILNPLAKTIEELELCHSFKYELRPVDANGIPAKLILTYIEGLIPDHEGEIKKAIPKLIDKLDLSDKAWKLMLDVWNDLIEADIKFGRYHHQINERLTLDAIFQVVGSLFLLDKGGFLDGVIYATPPSLGGEHVKTADIYPAVPSPDALDILCKYQIECSGSSTDGGFTDAIGASLLAHISDEIVEVYPSMTPKRIGYGTRSQKMGEMHHLLRVVEGINNDVVRDRIIMLETNVDDLSGEVIGYAAQKLMKEGAVDVFITPAMGKKNRPINVISVITSYKYHQTHIKILMKETGSLGVRIREIPRLVAERTNQIYQLELFGKTFDVKVKISTVDGEIISAKPEYEHLRRIAEELNVPLRMVLDTAKKKLPIFDGNTKY